MPRHTLTEAYAALRREEQQKWAKAQRELAESTGNPELIAATEKMIERRMGEHATS